MFCHDSIVLRHCRTCKVRSYANSARTPSQSQTTVNGSIEWNRGSQFDTPGVIWRERPVRRRGLQIAYAVSDLCANSIKAAPCVPHLYQPFQPRQQRCDSSAELVSGEQEGQDLLDLDPKRGIAAGERWKAALQKAAHRCEVVLALVSTHWLASEWCKAETDAARLMGKKIIVVIIGAARSAVPADLTDEQWIDLFGDVAGYDRLKEGLRRAGLDPATFPFDTGRRPYPGLSSLEERDAAIFFGREAQIVRGLDKLRGMARAGVNRMLVVLGASGAGKSSFVRAGLWPRLKRDDRHGCRCRSYDPSGL